MCLCVFCSLQETYEAKRKEFLGDLQRKEEEMRQMFVNKVKETEAELKEKEREVRGLTAFTLSLHNEKQLIALPTAPQLPRFSKT